jgi:hypothetical protein
VPEHPMLSRGFYQWENNLPFILRSALGMQTSSRPIHPFFATHRSFTKVFSAMLRIRN